MKQESVELVIKAQNGDQEALVMLFEYSYKKMYATAFRILKNDADTKDVIQEVFLELQRSIKDLKEPEVFFTWLNRVVTSKCYRLLKKGNKYIAMDKQHIEELSTYQEKRSYLLPEDHYTKSNEQEVLYQLLSELKPKYACILEMVYLKQMKLQEIAEELEIPLGTVKSQVLRARLMLKKKIEHFEKMEGRTLELHIDSLMPAFGVGMLGKIKGLLAGAGSSTGFAVAATAGVILCSTVFIDTFQKSSTPLAQNIIPDLEQAEPVAIGTFEYANQTITTSKDAYFVCLGWAYDLNEMKKRTKGQVQRILPIYEALKEKGDQYWNALSERGWAKDFERIVDVYN